MNELLRRRRLEAFLPLLSRRKFQPFPQPIVVCDEEWILVRQDDSVKMKWPDTVPKPNIHQNTLMFSWSSAGRSLWWNFIPISWKLASRLQLTPATPRDETMRVLANKRSDWSTKTSEISCKTVLGHMWHKQWCSSYWASLETLFTQRIHQALHLLTTTTSALDHFLQAKTSNSQHDVEKVFN